MTATASTSALRVIPPTTPQTDAMHLGSPNGNTAALQSNAFIIAKHWYKYVVGRAASGRRSLALTVCASVLLRQTGRAVPKALPAVQCRQPVLPQGS